MSRPAHAPVLVGSDVGGTFTDFVVLSGDQIRIHKRATTPDDQSRAIVDGLAELDLSAVDLAIVHGTTVATNALLERRGARTALLTTAGFADVLVIGRQNRPHLYRLHQERPPVLASADLRFEVAERLDPTGAVLVELDESAVTALAQQLADRAPESLAIVFLFSFQNPQHEQRAAQLIQAVCPDLPISLSSDILPEYREYERTATTVINAYVRPLVSRYLDRLSSALRDEGTDERRAQPAPSLRIMQSNGGAIGRQQAAREPARLVLSGPAGGVVGAFSLLQQATGNPQPRIITFDMGGTSTDVALCPGTILRTAESEIAGLPLRLPVIDIHTVGAGGGSLAYVDAGGGLRVGPQSAGAVPGPVCYGQGGTQPTVTDANLVLGRLAADHFLGGQGDVGLDATAADTALATLGRDLAGYSPQEAALGVVQVANATMERALRRVSVERGHDPKEFTLAPFGGAGPLHACDLADALGITRIFVPPSPGVLSALGMLVADVVYETSQAVLQEAAQLATDVTPLQELFAELAGQTRGVLQAEGIDEPAVAADLDVRYRGQSYELTVSLQTPVSTAALTAAVDAFHDAHAQRYGYAMMAEPVEIVTLRVRGIGPGARPQWPRAVLGPADASAARLGTRPIWFQAQAPLQASAYERSRLQPGNRLDGPAILFQFDTTILVAPGWQARVDEWRNVWLERNDD